MDLSRFQSKFRELLRAGKGFPEQGAWLKETAKVSLETRIEIYHYAYWARIKESLIEDFPRVRRRVGPKKFALLMREYILKHPSRYSSLAEVSGPFTLFLKKHAILEEFSSLYDLSRFEWMKILARLAEPLGSSNLGELAHLPAEQLPNVIFLLHPSVQFFESKFPVTQKPRRRLLLYSRNRKVHLRSMGKKHWALLRKIEKKMSIGEIALNLSSLGLDEKDVFQCFAKWSELGILYSYEKTL